jgi:uncharacterized membrane protein
LAVFRQVQVLEDYSKFQERLEAEMLVAQAAAAVVAKEEQEHQIAVDLLEATEERVLTLLYLAHLLTMQLVVAVVDTLMMVVLLVVHPQLLVDMVVIQVEVHQLTEVVVAAVVDMPQTVAQVVQVLFILNTQALKEVQAVQCLLQEDLQFIRLQALGHTQHEPLCKSRKRYCCRCHCC